MVIVKNAAMSPHIYVTYIHRYIEFETLQMFGGLRVQLPP